MEQGFWWCILLVVSSTTGVWSDETCTSQATSAVRLSALGRVNETGQRLVQATLRGNVPIGEDNGLIVEHWTENCEDRQIVALNVSLLTNTNNAGENPVQVSTSKITQGVSRRPRRLDYCLILPGLGAYKAHEDAKSWEDAKRCCEEENSHLAVIESKEEFDLLSDMLRHVGKKWSHITVWIGVHRRNGSSIWRNVLGRPLGHSNFLKWGSGWPSRSGECGALRIYLTQKRVRYLSDAKCDLPLYYVCEQDL